MAHFLSNQRERYRNDSCTDVSVSLFLLTDNAFATYAARVQSQTLGIPALPCCGDESSN